MSNTADSAAALNLALNAIQSACEKGKWRLAADLIATELEHHSHNPILLKIKADVAFARKRWREAYATLARIFELEPGREWDYHTLFRGDVDPRVTFPFAGYRQRGRLYAVLAGLVASAVGVGGFAAFGAWGAVGGVLMIAGAACGAELLYRLHLYRHCACAGERDAYPANLAPANFYVAVDAETQVYHPVRGFDLQPNTRFVRVGVLNGRVVEAYEAVSDVNGNVGCTDEAFSPDALNVLIVGDSYTNFPGNGAEADGRQGVEWPYFFRKQLVKNGYGNVRILNYARSGHGVLQMIDTAADLVDRLKPDIIICAFITRDLDRYRYWHVTREVGGQLRSFRTQVPNPDGALADMADQNIVDPRITLDWAKERMARGDEDALLKELNARYQSLRRRTSTRRIDLLSPRRCYVLDRLLFGTPFIDMDLSSRASWQKYTYLDFAADPQFMAAVAKIKAAGSKLLLVHIPDINDVQRGDFHFTREEQVTMMRGLSLATGEPVWALLLALTKVLNLDKTVVAQKYSRYAHDAHPSVWAQEVIAKLLATLVVRGKLGAVFDKAKSG
jgi:hypothetical protein